MNETIYKIMFSVCTGILGSLIIVPELREGFGIIVFTSISVLMVYIRILNEKDLGEWI